MHLSQLLSRCRSLTITTIFSALGSSVLWAAETAPVFQSAADRLEQAFFLEQTLGAWDAAEALYRQVSLDPDADEGLRAIAEERLETRLAAQPGERVFVAADDTKAANAESKIGETVAEAAKAIQSAYAREVKDEELLEGALQGMLAKLDGDASYLSAADLREMSQAIDQQLVGVGLQLKFNAGQIVVVAPVPGSPGEKSGIVPGDSIVAVGDAKLADVAEDQRLLTAVRLIRGPAGEKVKITVQPLKGESKTVEIERAAIELESIRGDGRAEAANDEGAQASGWRTMIDPERKIGYLRILQFGRRTSDELRAALEKLKEEGMKALVLDLRDNPGGLLEPSLEAADLFLDDGEIVSVRGREGQVDKFEAKAEGTIGDLPLAVIVNRNTSSGAEILAAALQDHRRATIVGERTFGRGIVQRIVPLESTGGAIRLTSAVYTRPTGQPLKRERVNGVPKEGDEIGGVSPDAGFAIELSEDELRQYYEYRQERDFPTPGATGQLEFTDRALEKALEAVRQ